jgi:fatty-acyl-CoA synthase
MKYAFSTLACPAWSVEEVVGAATRFGYDGIEFRLLDGEAIDPRAHRGRAARAVASCRRSGMEVCAFDTMCRFNDPDRAERTRQVEELLTWIDLAHDLQVPRLRVFGGRDQAQSRPTPPPDEANTWVVESLRAAAPSAERAGVTIMLETHYAFSSAQRVAAVLQQVPSTHVAALWDSQHTHRVGESVEDVLQALGARLAHVHIKDARRRTPDGAAWEVVLLGEGEVPVREQLDALHHHGYAGYISVEWEWHPEAVEPEVALAQYITWLNALTLPDV